MFFYYNFEFLLSVLFLVPITFGKNSEFHADLDSLNLVLPIRSKEEAILVFRLVQYTVIIIMVKRYSVILSFVCD